MKKFILFCIIATSVPCWAIPQLINYQGYLTRTDETPLDTVVAVTFALYASSSGGTAIWTETQPACVVQAGHFDVKLGTLVNLPDSFHLAEVWLGIQVGSDAEMAPRSRLTSVPYAYRVGTIDGASGGVVTGDATIIGKGTIGYGNINTGVGAFVAGVNDTAFGYCATVGGGEYNSATTWHTTVSGGAVNTASGNVSTVSGGTGNSASGDGATISGGISNGASNTWTTVSGGIGNQATGQGTTIGGGSYNAASQSDATICGGGVNSASGAASTIAGGSYNSTLGDSATVGGGAHNSAEGSAATVAGGSHNTASSINATVGGGTHNTASGGTSAVGGGSNNSASGAFATVSGGISNVASGWAAMVPGGSACSATGGFSLAAGFRARAIHENSFVWADGQNNDYSSDGVNSFNVRAFGGVKMYTSAAGGAHLPASSSSWIAISDSAKKTDIQRVDTKFVLDKVCSLPVQQWRYKDQPDPSVRHIGPMAQDFWRAFRLGEDSLGISTIDPDGVALAAIQELAKRNEQLEQRVKQLESALLQYGHNETNKSE